MSGIIPVWRWLRARLREQRIRMQLCLRVTVAAITAFILAQYLTIPLAGLWTVLTAVIVTQSSIGGSLKATIEYWVGTLGGAFYAGAIADLIPHHDQISLLAVLALAIAPLAFLAALNPHFRVGPFTAVIVVLGGTALHANPIGSAFYRVAEVGLGGAIGLVVSVLVLPARAQGLLIAAAAKMLDQLARALPQLLAGVTHGLDPEKLLQVQNDLGAAFARADAVTVDARRERTALFGTESDPGPLLRTLLRLRHDLIMIGRATAVPFPEILEPRLAPSTRRLGEAAAEFLGAARAALIAEHAAPTLEGFGTALEDFAAAIATARREGVTHALPDDAVERMFALAFSLEQLHQHFIDLARCLNEFAQSPAVPVGDTEVKRA